MARQKTPLQQLGKLHKPLGRLDPATGRFIPAPTPTPISPARTPALPLTPTPTPPLGRLTVRATPVTGRIVPTPTPVIPPVGRIDPATGRAILTPLPTPTPTPRITPTPTPLPEPKLTLTPTAHPKVGVSAIDAGKDLIAYMSGLGLSTDASSLKRLYREGGLERRFGTWVGSSTQYKALRSLIEVEQNIREIEAGIKTAQARIGTLDQARAAGMTITPQTTVAEAQRFLADRQPAEIPPDTALTPDDLTSIITDISTGAIKIPEVELAKEGAELARGQEIARAEQALERTQQMLAAQGMTFSGIRTAAEERLAAEHLSNISGISLGLAGKIIAAARDEERRRQPEYRAVGGDLYEIRPGQAPRMIIAGPPPAPTIIGTAETGYFQWNPAINQWEKTGIQAVGRAPEVIGSAQTGYFQWNAERRTWVPTGIKAAETTIPPITWNEKVLDISSVEGLTQFRNAGGDRATAMAWLDINTDYTISTIDAMINQVYGRGMPDSVAGQQQELAKDLMALDINEINAMARAADMNPREYVKEKIIKAAGFNPDDKFWNSFLNRFPGGLGWFLFGEPGLGR